MKKISTQKQKHFCEENIYIKTKNIFMMKISTQNWSPVEDGEDVTTFHWLDVVSILMPPCPVSPVSDQRRPGPGDGHRHHYGNDGAPSCCRQWTLSIVSIRSDLNYTHQTLLKFYPGPGHPHRLGSITIYHRPGLET